MQQALPRLLRSRNALQQLINGLPLAMEGAAVGARSFADDANLKHTMLYDLHVANGGKVV